MMRYVYKDEECLSRFVELSLIDRDSVRHVLRQLRYFLRYSNIHIVCYSSTGINNTASDIISPVSTVLFSRLTS